MALDLNQLAWPLARLPEALRRWSAPGGAPAESVPATLPPPPAHAADGTVGPWLESAATRLGLEALRVDVRYAGAATLLRSAAPAVLRLPDGDQPQFLVLAANRRGGGVLLSPDFELRPVPLDALASRLAAPLEAAVAAPLDDLLDRTGFSGRRRRTARDALLRELHAGESLGSCWLIRPADRTPLVALARAAGLGRLLASAGLCHVGQYALWIVAWWLLGWMSVHGRFDPGLFWAWLLVLLAVVPLRILTDAAAGTFAIRAGALLKRRLLAATFRLETDEVRQWGVGQLLGRVVEAESIESLAIGGGFLAATAGVELLVTVFVLGLGAGSWLHVGLLAATLAVTLAFCVRFYRTRLAWTEHRLAMTNDMVERMIGHRTRLAQEPRSEWNRGEDEALDQYLALSRQTDHQAAVLGAVVPRGWLLVGLLGLAPTFLTASRSSVALAVGLGGVLLAYRALASLVEGSRQIAAAIIAWQRIRYLARAAARREPIGQPHSGLPRPTNDRPILTARQLAFRYSHRGRPVLQDIDLTVHPGQRILLQGASGGGKSTLTALLAGIRLPESGLILLHGLDRETLGTETWRRRVVVAPQFHENHVLTGSFAFNLLLGGRWPPQADDMDEAERTCRELGLGPLLDRMPGGMFQIVGETGWQLSHGEKSRLYIARALLQHADLTILDESFAALDPETLRRTLTYVLERTPTVLVVAHP